MTRIGEKKFPYASALVLLCIVTGCAFSALWLPGNPAYMNLYDVGRPPGRAFWFGTDSLGRDLFRMVWHGGGVSIYIGLLSAALSTLIAVGYGCASGLAGRAVDALLMRFTELLLSVPSILPVIFLQAMLGDATPSSIAVIIGLTSWMNISKIVRSEALQIRGCDYVLAARAMGGRFAYVLTRHLAPNFFAGVMFMVVTNVSQAIGTEATLCFLGIGLPLQIVSWGSMMSMSERAMLSGQWWVILIPGFFLITTLVCITDIGEYLRGRNAKPYGNL
jgi:peptide/nickel transport system permease protein